MPSDLLGPKWEPFDGRIRCEVDWRGQRYLVVYRPDVPPSKWRKDRVLSSVMGRSPEHRHGSTTYPAVLDGVPTVVVATTVAAAAATLAIFGFLHPSGVVGLWLFAAVLATAFVTSWGVVLRNSRNWCRVRVTEDSLLYTTWEMACQAERDALAVGDAAVNPQQIRGGLWAGLWAVALMHTQIPAGDSLRRREVYDATAALHRQVSAINHRLEGVARQYAERLQCSPDSVMPRMRDPVLDVALNTLADAEHAIVAPPPPTLP
jgi:hypothetical protein